VSERRGRACSHGALNLIIVGLFVANLVLRSVGYPPTALPITLSAVGVGVLLVSGWFGWELIYGQGVAVSPRDRGEGAGPEGRGVIGG